MNWLKLVETLAPFVLKVIPGFPSALVPIVISAIQVAEQVPGALGPEKKAIVMDTLAQHPASNQASWNTMSAGVDTVIAAVNAVQVNNPLATQKASNLVYECNDCHRLPRS